MFEYGGLANFFNRMNSNFTPGLKGAEAAIKEALDSGSEKLDLGFFQLETLPTSIYQVAPQLKALNLKGNNFLKCPNFEAFSNLQYLNLSSNVIGILHPSLGTLVNLETLNISGNIIVILPEFLTQLSNLKSLYAQRNRITTLPEGLGNLESLGYLFLNRNQLTSLPTSFCDLKNLRFFIGSGNKLTSLPEGLENLKNLEHFDVSNNAWKELLPEVVTLRDPKFLKMETNFKGTS